MEDLLHLRIRDAPAMRITARNPDLLLRECDNGLVIKNHGPICVIFTRLDKHRIARAQRRSDRDKLFKFVDHAGS